MQITINPSNILGWGGVIGLVASAIIFFIYQVRRNDLHLLRESIADLTARVEFLEKEKNRLEEDLAKKTMDYDNIKFKKNYLKQLIMESLAKRKDLSETLITEMIDGRITKKEDERT